MLTARLHRRKTKMFRFTPTPVSSASIFWWCGKGGFADRKCTLDDSLDRWFDDRFPPLSIYHGGRDYLVLAEPLLERLKEKEKDVKVIKVTKLDHSEHCDFYWAAEAVEWAYMSFMGEMTFFVNMTYQKLTVRRYRVDAPSIP